MFLVGMCLNSFLSSPRKHMDSLLALILHVTASVMVILFLGWQSWLLLIFIPFFIAFAIGAYLFYAQHNFPGVSFNNKEDWCYHAAAMESSSYIVMHPVMAWFTGNIGYHHIHHLNARIPFYRLPEAMKAIPALQQPKTTSLRFRDIYACFRLKVWDVESKQMAGIH
jgi:omega-6 fatty acid desaturase (delta-12 desaturase)